MPHEKKEDELGALWQEHGRNGTYFTGTIGGQPVIVLPNNFKKEGSKQPDWRVLKRQPKEERGGYAKAGAPSKETPF